MAATRTGSRTAAPASAFGGGDPLGTLVAFVGARAGAGAGRLLERLALPERERALRLLDAWRRLPSHERQALVIRLFCAPGAPRSADAARPPPTPLAARVRARLRREQAAVSAGADG